MARRTFGAEERAYCCAETDLVQHIGTEILGQMQGFALMTL